MKSKPRASAGSSLNLSRRASHFWRVLPAILLLAVSAYATESEAFRAIVARMSGAPGLGMERLAITIDRYTTDQRRQMTSLDPIGRAVCEPAIGCNKLLGSETLVK